MNSKTIFLIAQIIVASGLNGTIIAQEKLYGIDISGAIADSITQKPLEFITVSLIDDNDVIANVGLTKTDGTFVLSNIQPSKYFLVITAAGYMTKMISVDWTDSSKKNEEIGVVFISRKTKDLEEVVITANKPIIKQEIDRISYDLQADPESKIKSVLEMMRKLPYVFLDANGNVLLKGNSNFRILLNGKPSAIIEGNPQQILRSMPASTIQRIEVITTPPAKYDAEGLAGIINIITMKRVAGGYNGTLNINQSLPTGGPGLGGSLNLKKGKFGISAFGGESRNKTPNTNYFNDRFASGTGENLLQQQGERRSRGRNGYFGTEISYEIDSLKLISGQVNINGYKTKGIDNQTSAFNDSVGNATGYEIHNKSTNFGNGLDASLNYQIASKIDKNRLFTFSYRYFKYTNDQNADLSFSNKINYPLDDYQQTNEGITAEHTVQADYVGTVKKVNIEAGVKAILRTNKSDFHYREFDSASGGFKENPSLASLFDNNQKIFGLYNTYQYSSKHIDFKAGVRIEQTLVDVDFISTVTKVRQDYFNVIPSIVLNGRLSDKSTLNLGFTQRIKRPGINRLNPFVDRSNPNFEFTGNPNLRPVVLNNLQLSYGFAGKLSSNLSLSYSFGNNLDLRIAVFDPVKNITRVRYENTGKANRLGLDFYAGYPIAKNWNLTLNGNVASMLVEGVVDNELITVRRNVYYISAASDYNLPKDWHLNASLNITSKNLIDLQGTSNGFISPSFSISKSLPGNKLSFSAAVNNAFSKFRNNILETSGPRFEETNKVREYFQVFSFAVNYRFGKLKDCLRRATRSIRNDDLSN